MNMAPFCIDNLSFGNLPKETLVEIFKDGRASSKLMEYYFANKFDMTTVAGDKDHDLVSKKGIKYEVKAFTKYGCNFRPSMHSGDKGLSKRIKEEEGKEALQKHKDKLNKEFISRVSDLVYIIYDLTEFPNIRYQIIQGKKLIKKYPSGKIPFKNKEKFFGKT